MALIVRANKLCGNANALSNAADTALENPLHAEFTGDLADAFGGFLVAERGGAGNHTEVIGIQTRQLRDHLFREAITEVFLREVAAEVFERQDRQHGYATVGDPAWRSDEAISTASECLDVLRLLSRIAKRFSQLGQGGVKPIVKVHKGVAGPQSVMQFVAGDQFPGVLQQRCKNLEWLILQTNPEPLLAQLPGAQVHVKWAEARCAAGI